MKKQSYLIILTLCLSLFTSLVAKSTVASEAAFKSTDIDQVSNPAISVVNINNMAYWIEKSGAGTTQGSPNGTQADYPVFTGGLIYEDGMLWGIKANEYPESAPVRVGGSTYAKGMKAGYVVHDADGNVVGADDPVNHHVWRVRTDWETADLSKDAANFYKTTSGDVSEEQIQDVKDQYESDWMNWPAAWGAPYENNDGVDGYDPTNGDIPGYPGAHQTVWTISNDVPTIVDADGIAIDTLNTAPNLYGADPVGVELRVTMWGYAFGASDPLGNVVFKKAELTYTGLEATSGTVNPEVLDSVYFTQWSDPDLGTYTDDYVGTDVDLSFGYVYNGNRLDGVFNGIFNLACPAGGYDFLQGPADNLDIDGDGDLTEYLPMTAFTYFGAGSSISDPDLGYYEGSLQFFNLMEGYLPRPEYPTQVPWTDLSTGESTMFALSGDPVSGSGWIDGVQLPPGDRRLVMASGPYEMTKGETATVVLALVAGTGLDAVSSVSVAKYYDTYAQYAYDQGFSLPSAPTTPSLTAVEMDGSISLDWGSDVTAVSATESIVSEGFEFEGYNVYQLPSAGSPLTEGVKVATFDKVNLVQNILDPDVDALTGLVVNVVKQTGSDAGVQRFYNTDYDEVRGRPMSNGLKYHFAVTAYSYLAENEGSPFKTLESGEARLTVTPHSVNPGVEVANINGSDVTVDHDGTANASVNVNIVNSNNLKDESYEVSFVKQQFYLDWNGNWSKSETSGRSTGKVTDCSGSSVSAVAMPAGDGATINLVLDFNLVCPGGAWIDGIQMTFPEGFSSNVNSWGITGGGNVCSYGTGSGQNCDNLDGSWDGDVLLFGNDARTGFGAFESSNVFTVNYTQPNYTPGSGEFEPVTVNYVVYDDAYDGTIIDGEGATTASELGYELKYEYHWFLTDESGNVLLEDQTFINGEDLYGGMSVDNMSKLHHNSSAAVTVDGFQVNVEGGYDSPIDAYGHEVTAGPMDISEVGDAIFDVDSYAQNGWALTAKAVDTWGSGITSVDYLQRDIQIRFTGEFEDTPITTDAGVVYYPAKAEGGSDCWIDGSRVGDFAAHPANPDPGSSAPFRIRIPFEVWDMEAEGGPQQIDITIYDRLQGYSAGDTVYAFNPYDRMYTHFIHLPYNPDGNYGETNSGWGEVYGDGVGEIEENLTWNAVWWSTQFNQGDTLTFQYANPIQAGADVFSFSMKANTVSASNDLSNVSVYPNPYYGFHEAEAARNDKFVSMNNLPQKATVKIYSLGGTFVREIDKDDEGQFAEWDLKNQYGYPVASGLYIMRITSGDQEKVVKLALVQETQVLKYY